MKEMPGIIYEDESLIAFDKPAGLLTAPDRWDKSADNLMTMIHTRLSPEYFNVHRLDREASGVLLCAKNKTVLKAVCKLFESRDIFKEYVTLVHGGPAKDKDTIALAIAPDSIQVGLMRVVANNKGRISETSYEVLEKFRKYSFLKVNPLTGRQHQIRVHLAGIGCPIVADSPYGGKVLLLSRLKPDYRFKNNRPELPLLKRVALHSSKLGFQHPVTGVPVTVEAPLPKDFVVSLKYLRRWG